jgi:hypothetical protein
VGGCVWGLRVVGGAMKEGGKGGNVAIYREDFSEEVGGVDEAGEEYKAEKMLSHPLLQPAETHIDRLGLLRANEEVARPIAHSLSTNRRGGEC